jgi:FlaA1/EpsC-like NDP-sugar epimerase
LKNLEALLGRSLLHFDTAPLRARIGGRRVLVTGAAGSIGSELCRQIAASAPEKLIGLDNAETPLFLIDQELRRTHPRLEFFPEIGDITRAAHMEAVFDRHKPEIIFHAAAYKHVPMMELHPFAAVETNIFGTAEVAEAAIRHGVEDFVLISSDKAVRPSSIMGATKRISEMLMHALQPTSSTRFYSVRFGNVLGSSGSVIPIFEEQIAAGGPLTVTHPEMRRYFMTIPEATGLVLQALALGKGGELFILDMGESVRIIDLAERMIRISGRNIEIQFTGTRPGEKLFEELNLESEDLQPTANERIKIYRSALTLKVNGMNSTLDELRGMVAAQDRDGLVALLMRLIPDFSPDTQI